MDILRTLIQNSLMLSCYIVNNFWFLVSSISHLWTKQDITGLHLSLSTIFPTLYGLKHRFTVRENNSINYKNNGVHL